MTNPPSEWTLAPDAAGGALDALVRARFGQSWGRARGWIETGKVFVNDARVTDGRFVPAPGARLALRMNAPRDAGPAPYALPRERILHADSQLVVVDKPAGVSAVPFDERERGTLSQAVGALLKVRVEVVHRLDKETSGVMVFARTPEAARHLAQQFRFHTISRRYLALAHGAVGSGPIRSTLLENRGDGLRGSARAGYRVAPGEGQPATTHVRALRALEGATLVECRLETGRTHQIRIHLAEAGHPLLGEKLYARDYAGGRLCAPRVMLHAAELGFVHPGTGAAMTWRRDPPADFADRLRELGLTRASSRAGASP